MEIKQEFLPMSGPVRLPKSTTRIASEEIVSNQGGGFMGFAVVSGTGWLLDVGLTMGSVYAGAHPFWASLFGAGVAVTFVYFVSLRRIFEVGGRLGARGFPFYVIWQVFAISVTSVLVALVVDLLAPVSAAALSRLAPDGAADPLTYSSGAAKAFVTPLTLVANYLFMKWLTVRLESNH